MLLFNHTDLPILNPVRPVDPRFAERLPKAVRRVHIAVWHPDTGRIAQVVECSETDMAKQHAHWPGHDFLEVPPDTSAKLHAVDPTTGKLIDKDQTEEIAAQKVRDSRAAAADKITGGFLSEALGERHLYPSNPTDQLNLMTTAITGGGLHCADEDGVWDFKDHTAAQAAKVLADFVAHRDGHRASLINSRP